MQNKIIKKVIKKDKIKNWINELMKNYKVIAPVKEGDEDVFFRIIKSADDVCMDFQNTVLSPKEFFFPKSEKIFEFEGDEISDSGSKIGRKRILFGVRPCDVHGLTILDNVYKGEFNDPYYLQRRENTTIISLACSEPDENCFCKSLGTGPVLCDADLIITDLGDKYFIEAKTEDMNLVNFDIIKEAAPGDVELKDMKQKESEDKITRAIELNKNLDDLHLESESRKCLGCGCCTYICPTCTCFDVSDESMISKQKGKRFRCWDSCMFPSFALLAGGENTRKEKSDRFKQRFYHKFKYYPEKYGKVMCVGCGRCTRKCPVNTDVVKIINYNKLDCNY